MKEKSFDRRNELLEAALEEFITNSYEDASLNNIIKNAGISKGTFYYHFKNKRALYFSIMEACVESKLEFLEKRMQEGSSEEKDKDIFEIFKLQGRIGVEFALSHPKYYLLGGRFLKEKGNSIYNDMMNLLGSNTEKYVDEMIDSAVKHGDFREDIPIDFIQKMITYIFIHFNDMFCTEGELELETMLRDLDNCIDFMQFGLGKNKI